MEIETRLMIAKHLEYLDPANADTLLADADEFGRLLNGLIASTKN